MFRKHSLLCLVLISLVITACQEKEKTSPFDYPKTSKVKVSDTYFGTEVADPYRWLENDQSDSTKAWVVEQNKVTFSYLEKLPLRQQIKEDITAVWDYPTKSMPLRRGKYFITSQNTGKQNQNVLYISENLEENGKVLLDPNTLSEDGTVSLATFAVSEDAKYLAYAISRSGSDWREIYVKEIETNQLLKDHILWAKFSNITWYKDGFFYSCYPAPKEGEALKGANLNNQVYYHKVGTTQDKDQLIYKDPANPKWGFAVYKPKSSDKYLVLSTNESTSGNALAVMNLKNIKQEPTKIITSFDKDYTVVDVINNKLYVLTNDGAPCYQLVAIDPNKPAKKNWETIIPERKETLLGVSNTGGVLFASYLKDATSQLIQYSHLGKEMRQVEFPFIGTVSGFAGEADETAPFYSITSFTTPSNIYRYDIKTGKSSLYQKSKIKFDQDKYETKQVFYTSKDGTRVPMFITHKKGIVLDGNNPTLLYGYGGFNVSMKPGFNPPNVAWFEQGGVYAVANIRGGGEYGEEWHRNGTILKKQNVFNDFIAAAEYLIAEKYTSNKKLAIFGGSNGGLLVGACMTQRPDLFRVAIPAVGVLDMLRYHKFTIGRYWATDYGTSEDNKEMFDYLYAYSPVHNVKAGVEYPATMVTTADHDDRVVPAHSFKFISELQDKYKGQRPMLIRINTKAGHGAGKPKSMRIDEYADMWAFILSNMED